MANGGIIADPSITDLITSLAFLLGLVSVVLVRWIRSRGRALSAGKVSRETYLALSVPVLLVLGAATGLAGAAVSIHLANYFSVGSSNSILPLLIAGGCGLFTSLFGMLAGARWILIQPLKEGLEHQE